MVSVVVLATVAVLAQSREYYALVKSVDSVAKAQSFSGVITVAESDGDMDFARAYGTVDRVDAKFATGSLAETFTAVAVARLQQEHKITSDSARATIQPAYVQDHVFRWANMTHTSVDSTNAIDLILLANTLMRNPLPGVFTDGHGFFGGAGPGTYDVLDIYPKLDVIVVILSNQSASAAQHLREYLRDGLAALPVQR